jgi:putative CocE/NonD family hydrolase
MGTLTYRNSPDANGQSSSSISPATYSQGTRADVAVYSVSGWMDGAGYANGAISRFLTLPSTHKYLLLGPWDHGARINTSLWRNSETPEFDIMAEIARFFDEHLMGLDTGLRREQPVHYFTVRDEQWRAAGSWPPLPSGEPLYLNDHCLSASAGEPAADSYAVDFSIGTGTGTRYERIAAIDSRAYYSDWSGREQAMLSYTGAPLSHDQELTGNALASLWVSSSADDCSVHVYVSEILPDGTSLYVTEGLLRALHRRESPAPATHQTAGIFRSCTREDAEPMPIGEPQLLRFSLLPISWMFRAGSRIRVSIAGADADHCQRIPADQPVTLTLHRGGDYASFVSLPLRPHPSMPA